MIITIAIFFIAILAASTMLSFRAWELRTGRVINTEDSVKETTHFSFRQIEKSMLYLTKHIVQSIVLVVVKYWFIGLTKTHKWLESTWPKVHTFLKKKPQEIPTENRLSFFRRAIIESKIKINRIKEKVKKEHE